MAIDHTRLPRLAEEKDPQAHTDREYEIGQSELRSVQTKDLECQLRRGEEAAVNIAGAMYAAT